MEPETPSWEFVAKMACGARPTWTAIFCQSRRKRGILLPKWQSSPLDLDAILADRLVFDSGTISRHILLRGQFFPQFLRCQLEELPEAQVGQFQAQQAVRRPTFAAANSKAMQVPVQALQVQ
jgi:hypothetical protein